MKIIVGGGIAGLWLALECQARGMSCCVLEQGSLGQGQTLASQGMIHGGTKYALDGVLSAAATQIGAMPERWLQALDGKGTVSLRGVHLHRSNQLLWSTDSLKSQVVGFFASRAMSSRMQRIDPSDEPGFGDCGFSGLLYRLNEPVIDVASCLAAMAEQLGDRVMQATVTGLRMDGDRVTGVETSRGALSGDTVILTAGAGIEPLLTHPTHAGIRMQRRPLAMVAVQLRRHIAPLFGHHIGMGTKPKLTVSTHTRGADQTLYLGGQLAEEGVERSDEAQCERARDALKNSLGWQDLDIEHLSVFRIDRAEAATGQGQRPESAAVFARPGLIVGWPTKLALAPALADAILGQLSTEGIDQPTLWPKAGVGELPWIGA